MLRPCPPEFRARAIALVRRGRQIEQTALDLVIHEVTLYKRLRQDDVGQGRRPGLSTRESAELRAARERVRRLEQDIAILRRAATWFDEEGGVAPKGRPPPGDRPTSSKPGHPQAPAAAYWASPVRATTGTESSPPVPLHRAAAGCPARAPAGSSPSS